MRTTREPVKIRLKPLKDGSQSIYLDIYFKGLRRYEFLGIYLLPEGVKDAKIKNRESMQFAEAVKAKRIIEIRNNAYGFTTAASDVPLIDYIEAVMRRRERGNWKGFLVHMERFAKTAKVSDIDAAFGKRFMEYLCVAKCLYRVRGKEVKSNKPLLPGTQKRYWDLFKCVMNQAVADSLLQRSPLAGLKVDRKPNQERMYLSLDELKSMVATPVDNDMLRRTFLFSCLTGLRYSDVQNLTWGQVSEAGGYTRITFKQQKTGNTEYLDISPEAVKLMGSPANSKSYVFDGFVLTANDRFELRDWAKRAGINKPIVFHTARHTFAVMMLELDTDIYTVSKLLGHRDLKTTQIYAEIVDHKKREAISKIPALDLEL